MNHASQPSQESPLKHDDTSGGSLFAPVLVGIACWAAISAGFFGLKALMYERPEFVGPPMRSAQVELVQESPRVVVRKISDDVSVIKPFQPETSDVRFEMVGRRDYRGLRTVMDMSGEFRARYVLTNSFEEPVFVLFKCPHPRTQRDDNQTLPAGDLKLQSSVPGTQESARDAWLWSATLEPRSSAEVQISYHVASLKGVTYREREGNGNQVKQLRVTVQRKGIDSMRFESGDGSRVVPDQSVTWERNDFLAPDFFSATVVESRNIFSSLSQLLEIGPLVCLLFLLTVFAVILARQRLTVLQVLTVSAGYGIYFPLMLYLSARLPFTWALVIAFVVPGVLLVNYSRWLVGGALGLVGAPLLLALFQVFPTLAVFAGWNRGLVLLCLGIVTLALLINLQNRALRRKVAVVAAMGVLLAFPVPTSASGLQVILPAEMVQAAEAARREPTNTVIAFNPARYVVSHETNHLRVKLQLPFQVLRAGTTLVTLFNSPAYLQDAQIEPEEMQPAQIVASSNRMALFAERTGQGTVTLTYRVPIVNRDGRTWAQIPIALAPAGNVRIESPRGDMDVVTGSLWSKVATEHSTVYEIGVAGEDSLTVEWREQGGDAQGTGTQAPGSKDFYGIGVTHAQHLTVINSDSSCTHFSEFDLPVFQGDEFRIKLPDKARLISVSVNGNEIASPVVENQMCRMRLPAREGRQTAHRVSCRIAFPPVRLGFLGNVDLVLPEVFQTTGVLEWAVALPVGFDAQVISSGLERQKSSPDLGRFGDYGRILKSHELTSLAKDLAPPGAVGLSLKYRQLVPGMGDVSAAE